MNNNNYIDYVIDILSPYGTIKVRKMFGGYGVYLNNIFFAIIVNDILYFKVNEDNRPAYEAYDSKPFSYEMKHNKRITMSYWEVPAEILEHHKTLALWVSEAVKASQQTKK